MLAAFDEAPLGEFVEDAHQRDRLDLQQFGEAALMNAFVLREIGDSLPLRAREAEASGALLETLAE